MTSIWFNGLDAQRQGERSGIIEVWWSKFSAAAGVETVTAD